MIPAVSACGATAFPTYLWVAGGANGAMYVSTSTTASSWTSITSGFGTSQIQDIASNGTSLFVAVSDTGKLGTSPDGVSWTQQTSSFGTTAIYSVAYGNGVWVAGGGSNKIATSPDGVTWTQRTTGAATGVWSVGYGNGTWAILDQATGAIRTATDPTSTWTLRTSTLTGGQNVYYASTQAIWVAGAEILGTTGALASSPTGATWTARNSPTAAKSFQSFAANSSIIVMGMGSSGSADIATSTDGLTWTDRTPAVTTKGISAIAVDGTGLFATCSFDSGGNVQTSSNGTTWTDRGDIAVGVVMAAICHSSGG